MTSSNISATVGALRGVGVGRGAAIGPVLQFQVVPQPPFDEPDESPEAATERVRVALSELTAQLEAQAEASEGTLQEVLTVTAQMAGDPHLVTQASVHIEAGAGPALAVSQVIDELCETLEAAGGYLGERVTDLRSVRDRAVAKILGLGDPGDVDVPAGSVLVARDLAPADAAAVDLTKVAAIVTEEGGPTGHTAIIAAQLGLPCVVRVSGAVDLVTGTVVAVDAAAGTVQTDPDEAEREAIVARGERDRLLAENTAPGATSDGVAVGLLANIGTPEDADRLGESIEGVGLFRTEVLFLEQAKAPSVAAQAEAYRRVLAGPASAKVVVRTLDAGADKPLAFLSQGSEENPALGVRGYRTARHTPELLTGQLDALAQAAESTGTQPWVMAPMISTSAEAAEFAAAARERGIETVGVMVEVPSTALRAREILAEVDFVSIGTNDLAQYTMATDRLRGELSDLLDPFQPAVLDLIALTAEAGAEVSKPVGVCGESAADPLMALVLVGLGVTSLSMAPASIPAVRHILAGHTLAQCREIASLARSAASATDARDRVRAAAAPEIVEQLGL